MHYLNTSEGLRCAMYYAKCQVSALSSMLSFTEIGNTGGGATLRDNMVCSALDVLNLGARKTSKWTCQEHRAQ